MITETDFLHLPYTPDLSEAGAALGLRSANSNPATPDGAWFRGLQHTVARVGVELALRRYLLESKVPFDVTGTLPFSEPERFEVSLGGHRCEIVADLVTDRTRISEVRRDPTLLLDSFVSGAHASAAGQARSDGDLFIFAGCLGLLAKTASQLRKAIGAGQPCLLVHRLPVSWRNPKVWRPIGALALKSETNEPLEVEISGRNEGAQPVSTSIALEPKRRTVLENDFFSIGSIQLRQLAGSRIALRALRRGVTHVIGAGDYVNIWIYGMEIILAGFLSGSDLRYRRASSRTPSPPGRSSSPAGSVRVRDLKPLADLFEHVRAWHAARSA